MMVALSTAVSFAAPSSSTMINPKPGFEDQAL